MPAKSGSEVTRLGLGGAMWVPFNTANLGDKVVQYAAGEYNAISYFASGAVVTIEVWDSSTGVAETLNTAQCTELGSTGIYVWDAANLTNCPIEYQEFIFKMTDTTNTVYHGGHFEWPEPFKVSGLNPILHR